MSHGSEGSVKAILYALGANFGIAVAKYIAAFWTGSGSMLAEAIHSTADCANQMLLLLGLKQARRPASVDFPLGHHRVTYFWSMIVALMLFFMGGAFSVYEGVERLLHPQPLQHGLIAMAVLGCAVVGTAFAVLALVGPLALHALLPPDASGTAEMERYILSTGTSILSVVTVVIPPIITLVLGFYFGRKHNQ